MINYPTNAVTVSYVGGGCPDSAQFFNAVGILKHRIVLMTGYGAELRIAEERFGHS